MVGWRSPSYHTISFKAAICESYMYSFFRGRCAHFPPVYRWKCGCTSAAVVLLKLRCMPLFTPSSSSIFPLPTRTEACFGVGRGHGEEKRRQRVFYHSWVWLRPNLLHTKVKTSSPWMNGAGGSSLFSLVPLISQRDYGTARKAPIIWKD